MKPITRDVVNFVGAFFLAVFIFVGLMDWAFADPTPPPQADEAQMQAEYRLDVIEGAQE